MRLSLEKYSIEDGHFIFDDRGSGTYIEAKNLFHSGVGDFTLDVFDLDTKSTFSALTIKQGSLAYLNEAEGELDATFNIDVGNGVYTFKENDLRLNALHLMADGSIAMPGDDIVFDLNVKAPANNFRELWSMIPTAYVAGYDDIKANGAFSLNADVNGPFNAETSTYPAFNIALDVQGGSVQYPGRPIGVNGINADIKVNSPSADLNRMTVDIPRFALNLGGDPFSGNFRLRTPISDPTVDARVDGTLDLTKWAQAIPLEGISELAGKIIADVILQNVRSSVLTAGNYGAVDMSGELSIIDFVYAAEGLPKVELPRAKALFSPQFVSVPDFALQLGQSDLQGSARVDNILAYFSPEQTMKGSVKVKGRLFDANEWIPEEEPNTAAQGLTSTAAAPTNPAPAEVPASTELFNRFDFDIDAQVTEIRYADYQLKNNRVKGKIQANQLAVADIQTTLGETSLQGSGNVSNAWDYYFGDETMTGQLNLRSDYVDLADFMTTADASSTTSTSTASSSSAVASSAVIPVPDRVDVTVKLDADRVKYTNIELDKVVGDLVVRDQQVVVENGNMGIFGGRMDFAGAYDTSEPGAPGFRFHYDLSGLSFSSAFDQLNTFKQLAPIGQFIRGRFNSDLILEGKLGDDLSPIMSSINAQGFLQTLEASLATFKPLQSVGQALNVRELRQDINLSNIKSWFTIEEGKVSVQPFRVKLAGIPMEVSGKHGLGLDMDYNITAAVPREMIEGNIVAGAAMGMLDRLAGQAQSLGLNIQPGDTLNVGIGLTGTLSNPQTSLNLLGTNQGSGQSTGSALADAVGDQVQDEVNERIDEARSEAEEKVTEVRTEVETQVDEARDAVTEQANAAVDSVRSSVQNEIGRVQDQVANEVGNILGTSQDTTNNAQPGTSPGQQVEDAVDNIKDEISRFNPFGKKKKKKDGN
ncbi:MAG: AsmA-like C-terminal region-containing protein [Bacteroidota bacterium]